MTEWDCFGKNLESGRERIKTGSKVYHGGLREIADKMLLVSRFRLQRENENKYIFKGRI